MAAELIKGIEGLAVEFAPAVHSDQPAIREGSNRVLRLGESANYIPTKAATNIHFV